MSGDIVFEPSGLRAWTCRMAAPAAAAATPWATISSGCSGRFGLASLPWMPPVRAQVMTTGSAIRSLSHAAGGVANDERRLDQPGDALLAPLDALDQQLERLAAHPRARLVDGRQRQLPQPGDVDVVVADQRHVR